MLSFIQDWSISRGFSEFQTRRITAIWAKDHYNTSIVRDWEKGLIEDRDLENILDKNYLFNFKVLFGSD